MKLSSPAKRAAQTAALVMKSGELEAELRYAEKLYGASAADLLEVVSQIEERAGEVLLMGHNPVIQDLLEGLTGEIQHVPTTALARLTVDAESCSREARMSSGVDRPAERARGPLSRVEARGAAMLWAPWPGSSPSLKPRTPAASASARSPASPRST